MIRISIQNQLKLTIIFVSVLPILILGTVFTWQSYQDQVKASIRYQQEILNRACFQVSSFLNSTADHLYLFSSFVNIIHLNPKKLNHALHYMLKHTSKTHKMLFENIAMYDANFQRIDYVSDTNNNEKPFITQSILEKAFESQDVIFGNIDFDKDNQIKALQVAIPVFDSHVRLVKGVLAARIHMKSLQEILHHIQINTGLYCYIVNSNGMVLAHSNDARMMTNHKLLHPEQTGIRKGLFHKPAILQGQNITIGNQSIILITERPLKNALAFTINSMIQILIFIAGALIMSIIISVMIGKKFSVPVKILISKADQVCRGDFLQPVAMHRTDEFGTLAYAFNRMSETIESQISSLKTALAERDKALHSLSYSYNEMSQLTYISAHHLQEPVRVMINYSDLLERKYFHIMDQNGQKYISVIRNKCQFFKNLLDDILEYLSLNSIIIKKVECDSRQVVDEIIASYREELNSCDATIRISDLPVIYTDKSLLKKIITQLIRNSIKFRNQSPLVIEIDATEDESVWRFSIKDNGIGIEMDYAQKIFELFYKHHQQEQYSGTGFGLALCKKILVKLNGSIYLKQVDQGTHMEFFIPKGEKNEQI